MTANDTTSESPVSRPQENTRPSNSANARRDCGTSETEEFDSAKGLEGENDPGRNVRGISTTPECTTATTTDGEKRSNGNQGMERASEDSLCEACRVRATQKVELVGRASDPSPSPAVVAAELGGVRA